MNHILERQIITAVQDSSEDTTMLTRDTVFAKIDFRLNSAIFRLHTEAAATKHAPRQTQLLAELECSPVTLQFESRPRSRGMTFEASVGGLFLRDCATLDSIMPLLVAPQAKEKTQTHARQGLASFFPSTSSLSQSESSANSEQTLFDLVFERKPQRFNADYRFAWRWLIVVLTLVVTLFICFRLEMRSRPLEIVYNAKAIDRIKSFFTDGLGSASAHGATGGDTHRTSARADRDANSKYQRLKRNTRAEFQEALGTFLQNDEQVRDS